MSTINQRTSTNYKRVTIYKRPKLNKSPQRKGIVLRLRICTPRKPNSARRPVVKAMLSTQKKSSLAYSWSRSLNETSLENFN